MSIFRFFLILLLPVSLLAQEKPFSITGRLKNIDTRSVTLIYWRSGKEIRTTAAVTDHGYTFNGAITNEGTAILKEGTPDDPADAAHLLLFYLDGEAFRI